MSFIFILFFLNPSLSSHLCLANLHIWFLFMSLSNDESLLFVHLAVVCHRLGRSSSSCHRCLSSFSLKLRFYNYYILCWACLVAADLVIDVCQFFVCEWKRCFQKYKTRKIKQHRSRAPFSPAPSVVTGLIILLTRAHLTHQLHEVRTNGCIKNILFSPISRSSFCKFSLKGECFAPHLCHLLCGRVPKSQKLV